MDSEFERNLHVSVSYIGIHYNSYKIYLQKVIHIQVSCMVISEQVVNSWEDFYLQLNKNTLNGSH